MSADKVAQALKTVVFMGSGRDGRLGSRVLKWTTDLLAKDERFTVTRVLDPATFELPILKKTQFGYKDGEKAPAELDAAASDIKAADCFILLSCEYNHSIPPGLSNLLDHFGGSLYGYKPSGIITYSPSSWGGRHCAIQLRAITGELGCLSVSSMVGIAEVHNEFNADGTAVDDAKWTRRYDAMLKQLHWMGEAMKNQRDAKGVPK